MNTNPTGSIEQRFWRTVDTSAGIDGCWLWTGYHNKQGYGQIAYDGQRPRAAHRLSLILSGVDVPRDKLVLHSCDNPPCVNPAHLRIGTHADNRRDMYARDRQPAHQRPMTHCTRGHEMTPENSRKRYGDRGGPQCRMCVNAAVNRRRALYGRPSRARVSGDRSTAGPVSPFSGPGLSGRSPEPRDRLRASRTGAR